MGFSGRIAACNRNRANPVAAATAVGAQAPVAVAKSPRKLRGVPRYCIPGNTYIALMVASYISQ